MDIARGLLPLGGNQALYLDLLQQFVGNHGQDATRLAKHLAAGDLTAIEQDAHELKGLAATLGTHAIRDLAGELEQAARSDPTGEAARPILDRLAAELAACVTRLPRAAPGSESAPATEVDWPQTNPVLRRLEELLATHDTESNALFEQSQTLLQAALGATALKLGRQIRGFEYEDALETLRAVWKPDA